MRCRAHILGSVGVVSKRSPETISIVLRKFGGGAASLRVAQRALALVTRHPGTGASHGRIRYQGTGVVKRSHRCPMASLQGLNRSGVAGGTDARRAIARELAIRLGGGVARCTGHRF